MTWIDMSGRIRGSAFIYIGILMRMVVWLFTMNSLPSMIVTLKHFYRNSLWISLMQTQTLPYMHRRFPSH